MLGLDRQQTILIMSLKNVYETLKNYEYVLFDERLSRLRVCMDGEELITEMTNTHNPNARTVLKFKNEDQDVIIFSEHSITLNDCCGWKQTFMPLIPATL